MPMMPLGKEEPEVLPQQHCPFPEGEELPLRIRGTHPFQSKTKGKAIVSPFPEASQTGTQPCPSECHLRVFTGERARDWEWCEGLVFLLRLIQSSVGVPLVPLLLG